MTHLAQSVEQTVTSYGKKLTELCALYDKLIATDAKIINTELAYNKQHNIKIDEQITKTLFNASNPNSVFASQEKRDQILKPAKPTIVVFVRS